MKRVLKAHQAGTYLKRHVPVAASALCVDSSDVVRCTRTFGFPLVLKLAGALHKTDIGGVKIARNHAELRRSYVALMRTAKKHKLPHEVLAQEYVRGRELIIGITRDPAFGHALMLGIGGIHAELLHDVSFRICPITTKDAEEMIHELKMKQLLLGYRDEKPVNRALLKSVLVKVSKLPLKNTSIDELDINPFIINEKTGKVADARMVLS